MCLFWVSLTLLPIQGVKSKKKQFWGVNRRLSSQTREIEKRAYYQNYFTDSNQVLHSDKDLQVPFTGGPNTRTTNSRWWTAAILKNRKIAISRPHFDQFRSKFGKPTEVGPLESADR